MYITELEFLYFEQNLIEMCCYGLNFKLEQIECLRSENTPRRPMITHTIDSYQIPCHNKTKSKLQIRNICQKC